MAKRAPGGSSLHCTSRARDEAYKASMSLSWMLSTFDIGVRRGRRCPVPMRAGDARCRGSHSFDRQVQLAAAQTEQPCAHKGENCQTPWLFNGMRRL